MLYVLIMSGLPEPRAQVRERFAPDDARHRTLELSGLGLFKALMNLRGLIQSSFTADRDFYVLVDAGEGENDPFEIAPIRTLLKAWDLPHTIDLLDFLPPADNDAPPPTESKWPRAWFQRGATLYRLVVYSDAVTPAQIRGQLHGSEYFA